MPTAAEDNLICLSANGKTSSCARQAARDLLVATSEALVHFARESASEPWKRTRDDLLAGHHVSALLFEPRSGLLFAGLHFTGGLMVSADRGLSWEPRNNGFDSGHVYSLHVQYREDRTVLFAGTEPAMLYRSDDLGQSWTAISSIRDVPDTDKWLFPRSVPHVKHIASHPADPRTLYVCVEQGDLLKSVDDGKTWRQMVSVDRPDDIYRRDMHRVVFPSEDPDELYLTTGIGSYYSIDGGESWTRLTASNHVLAYPDPLFVLPGDNRELIMVGAGVAPGPHWAAAGTSDAHIMRSRDGGKSWEDRMEGIRRPVRGNLEAAAMHVSEESGVELFVGSACGELYLSTDLGDHWQMLTADIAPVSKGPHFRHFLTPEDRQAYEEKLRALGSFA